LSDEIVGPELLSAARKWLDWSRQGSHNCPVLRPGCIYGLGAVELEDGSEKGMEEVEGEVASRVLIFLTMLSSARHTAAWARQILKSRVADAVFPFLDSHVGTSRARRFEQQRGALSFIQNAFVCDGVPVPLVMEMAPEHTPEKLISRLCVHLSARCALQSIKVSEGAAPPAGLMKLMCNMTPDDGGESKLLYGLAQSALEYFAQDPELYEAAWKFVKQLDKSFDESTITSPCPRLISSILERVGLPKIAARDQCWGSDDGDESVEKVVVRQGKLAEIADVPDIGIRKCNFCGRLEEKKKQFSEASGAGKCSVCKSVYYCSRACQTKDWKAHKKFCVKPDCQSRPGLDSGNGVSSSSGPSGTHVGSGSQQRDVKREKTSAQEAKNELGDRGWTSPQDLWRHLEENPEEMKAIAEAIQGPF